MKIPQTKFQSNLAESQRLCKYKQCVNPKGKQYSTHIKQACVAFVAVNANDMQN